MTQPRLSTVYDFSDLRLHPDGTRVYQKSTNLRPDLVKVTTRDSRFNWIAKDAGGSATVPKFRKRQKAARERDEDGELDLKSQEESAEGGRESSEENEAARRDGKKRKPKRIDTRKPKRFKFAKDYNYLEPEASSIAAESPGIPNDTIQLPGPSADLLKCIHRFASEFYTERGQLLNISREYRKGRKMRALQRRARRVKRATRSEGHEDSVSTSGPESGSSEPDTSQHDSDSNSEDEASGESESDDGSENEEGRSGSKSAKGKGKANPNKFWKRKGRRRAEKLYTDMYKMFDGSAMMALGMLVQEQITRILIPDVPEGWEEEMKKHYGDVGQDDPAEEQTIEGTALADEIASTREDRVSRAQDEVVGPRVASQAKQSSNKAAESQSEQDIKENPAHQLDDTPLPSQSGHNLSTAGTQTGPGLGHEDDDDDDDPIQPWSEDSEESEESPDDIDRLSWARPR